MSDYVRPIVFIGASIVSGILTAGQSVWIQTSVMMAASVAATIAMDLIMPQKLDNANLAPSQAPKINYADYGTPLYYGVGRFRGNGFFLRYDPDRHWKATPITETIKTGFMGSQEVIKGYNHSASYELGFGQFHVDAIGKVWSNPDEKSLRGDNPGFTPITEDATNIQLQSNQVSGTMRLYRGSDTQINNSNLYDEVVNYRGVAFATFNNLQLGSMTTLPSIQCEFFSLPRPLDENGNVITEMEVRGSNDPNNPNYYTANPAAALFVLVVGKNEGQVPHSQVDIPSFVKASKILVDRHIGISVYLTSPSSIKDLQEAIVGSIDAYTSDDANGKMKFTLAWDFTSKYDNVKVATPDHYNDLEIFRQSWLETTNEIHCEWTDVERNYAPNLHIESLLPAYEVSKIANITKLNYSLFTDLNTVRRFASYNLYKICFPSSSFKFKLNRDKYNDLQVGDTILLRDDSLQVPNTFFPVQIVEIDFSEVDSHEISVSGVEDTNFLITSGSLDNIPNPLLTTPWMGGIDFSHEDIDKSADMTIKVEKFDPWRVNNANIYMTRNAFEGLFILAQRNTQAVTTADILIDVNNSGINLIGENQPFAITGELLEDYNGPKIDREGYIEFSLTRPSDNIDVWEVSSDSDDIVDLLDKEINYVIIGTEVMQVGDVEQIAENTYRFKNIIRGVYETPINNKVAGSKFYFVKKGLANNFIDFSTNDGDSLRLKAYPKVFGTPVTTSDDVNITYVKPRPYAPIFKQVNVNSNDVNLIIRPKWFDKGNGISDVLTTITSSEYPEITIEEYNGTTLIRTITPDQVITLEDPADPDAGVIEIDFVKTSSTNNIRVYQNFPDALRSTHLSVNV